MKMVRRGTQDRNRQEREGDQMKPRAGVHPGILILVLLVSASVPINAARARTNSQSGDPYVDRVVSFVPGNPASTCCNDPSAVLGPPDFSENPLAGFLTLGVGGSLTAEFVDNIAVDGPGPDIGILGDPANDEQVRVAVSPDGATFTSFGLVGESSQLDLATLGLKQIRFVRITDDGVGGAGGVSPGAEVDAVQALNSAAPGGSAPAPATGTAAPPPQSSKLAWVRTGGPLGGLGYDIRMRPDNPDIMYVTDAKSGVFKSTDGGKTWIPKNTGITARGDSQR